MCGAPAFRETQHWFLLVVTVVLLGTIFFSLYHLCLTEPLNKLVDNWLTIVSSYSCDHHRSSCDT